MRRAAHQRDQRVETSGSVSSAVAAVASLEAQGSGLSGRFPRGRFPRGSATFHHIDLDSAQLSRTDFPRHPPSASCQYNTQP